MLLTAVRHSLTVDRPYDGRMWTRLLITLVLALAAATPASAAKEYHASSFDSRIEVRDDGALLVTETIVFVFTEGTFTRVYRTIPTRRTDGIEVLSASMDGRALPQGSGPGQVEIRRKNGMRVEWRFAPVSGSAHRFELVYLARGVVRQEEGYDLLAWRALPSQHDYRIGSASVEIRAAATPSSTEVKTRRVDADTSVTPGDGIVRIQAGGIRKNGWIEPHLRFPAGALVAAPPLWQQRRNQQFAAAPTWLAIAGGILAAGFVLLIGLRQSYDAPPRATGATWSSVIPPDDLPPALAGAVAANGHVQLEHAMAALFGLAERGAVSIKEDPKRTWGVRSFDITRGPRGASLARHESVLLDVIFKDQTQHVSLSKARTALTRGWKSFRSAVESELREAGLLDAGRAAHRRRYLVLGTVLLVIALAAFGLCLPFINRFGPFPMLLPAAILLVALASYIFASSETPLSNEGVRRGEAWRGYKAHLKSPQDAEPPWGASASAEARILPYAVALGLAAAWAKWMKKRNVQLPAWFQPASHADAGPAFVAFISSGGAGAGSGSAGGGSGAAGGGGSGAG
jgi:hypothetical protein